MSGAVGGLVATAAFLGLRWRRLAGLEVPALSLLPYGFLLTLISLANGVGPARDMLEDLGAVFAGPGLPLLVSSAFASVLLGLNSDLLQTAVSGTVRQWLPTAGAVLAFVLAGEVVASSGAAGLLASGATAVGSLYAAVAPIVGALGGVLTGSNAASNALFMPPQVEAARALGVSDTLVAAEQNVAGSHASLLAPQRVVLAATATGLLGREGEIVRAALPPVAVSVVILALVGIFA